MLVTIKNRDINVIVGMRFLKELNKRFSIEVEGVPLPFGLQRLAMSLGQKDFSVLSDAIYAGSRTGLYKPTIDDIDDYLDNVDYHEYENLAKQLVEEINDSNATHLQWEDISKNLLPMDEKPSGAKAKSPTTRKNTKK